MEEKGREVNPGGRDLLGREGKHLTFSPDREEYGIGILKAAVNHVAVAAESGTKAEAAKNTADLIEGTVKKIREGSGLMEKTNKEFNEVANSTSKAGELVGEIAAASQEQAQGIEQVNRAITEMDKVVQQNAANAEESA